MGPKDYKLSVKLNKDWVQHKVKIGKSTIPQIILLDKSSRPSEITIVLHWISLRNRKVVVMHTFLKLDFSTQNNKSNADFLAFDFIAQYKSDSNVDFPNIGFLCTIQK